MSSHSAELHAWRFLVAARWTSAAISIDTPEAPNAHTE